MLQLMTWYNNNAVDHHINGLNIKRKKKIYHINGLGSDSCWRVFLKTNFAVPCHYPIIVG